MYGVSYETFWRLNPKRLEPFRTKRESEVKEQAITLDTLAWTIGSYVLDGMAQMFGKNHPPYPETPRGVNSSRNDVPEGKGEKMTDGARFAAFVSAHNRQLKERRKK